MTKANDVKKSTEQVVNVLKNSAYTWKQVVKQLSGLQSVTLKDGTKVTPSEAWGLLGVKSEKSVIKAKNVKAAWSDALVIDGAPLVRTKDAFTIDIDGNPYRLYDDDKKAVRFYGWHRMVNATDVDKARGDVKVTATRLLDGLFDSRFADDALKEASDSCDAAEAVASGFVDLSAKPNEYHDWKAVQRTANGWVFNGTETVNAAIKVA